jgi:hypothetical protein
MTDLTRFYDAKADHEHQLEELKTKIAATEGEIQLREGRIRELEQERKGALGGGNFDKAVELAAERAQVETEIESLAVQKSMAEEALDDRLSAVASQVMDVAREILVEAEPEIRELKAELEKAREAFEEQLKAVRKRCSEVQAMAQQSATFGALAGVTGTNPGLPDRFYHFNGSKYAPRIAKGTVPGDVNVHPDQVRKRPGQLTDDQKAEALRSRSSEGTATWGESVAMAAAHEVEHPRPRPSGASPSRAGVPSEFVTNCSMEA